MLRLSLMFESVLYQPLLSRQQIRNINHYHQIIVKMLLNDHTIMTFPSDDGPISVQELNFRVSQLGACVAAACGASPVSEKTTPWILEYAPCAFCRFMMFFARFEVSLCQLQGLPAGKLPAAIRQPRKKRAPGIWWYEPCVCTSARLSTAFVKF